MSFNSPEKGIHSNSGATTESEEFDQSSILMTKPLKECLEYAKGRYKQLDGDMAKICFFTAKMATMGGALTREAANSPIWEETDQDIAKRYGKAA